MTDVIIDMFEAKRKLFRQQNPHGQSMVDHIKKQCDEVRALLKAMEHLGPKRPFPTTVLHIMDKPFHEVVKAMDDNPDIAEWLSENMSAIRAQRMVTAI